MDIVKVMLVDDQQLMLEGLKTLLSIHEGIEVVATAQSGEEAIDLLGASEPDIILMDIRMPGMGGVAATKRIKELYPRIIILILTTFDDDVYIIDALRYGAGGYLLKDIAGEKLLNSIFDALSGNLLLTGKVAQKLAITAVQSNGDAMDHKMPKERLEFTEREMEISRALVKGLTSREIASQLFLTQGTVKNYLSSIYAKIGTNDRGKAVLFFKKYFEEDK